MSECRPLVLMVEDNQDVLRLNQKWLERGGFDTLCAETLAEARRILEGKSPDLVVLDILLPDGNGLEWLPEYKKLCGAPVLLCSGMGEDRHILQGLEAGGDDYIAKPYNVDILVARVKAMWRKEQEGRERMNAALAARTPERVIERGPLKLHILAGRCFMDGADANLTPKQYALLFTLILNEGREVSTKELYESAWGLPANDSTYVIKDHISKLRGKLGINEFTAVTITSEYGSGYRFDLAKL
ncbi:MAG: response regulator transcription factor [Clostridiales Family XIII bacterium]|jgi:DNA-binding response OmpR family regulator|nr:response regulator transcription factor [Clostridiales Family XIII bacterium]